jgi:protein-disulfide isomerase
VISQNIDRYAKKFRVDTQLLQQALEDGSAREAQPRFEALGRHYGVRGRPAWLINGKLISGLPAAERFERLIL